MTITAGRPARTSSGAITALPASQPASEMVPLSDRARYMQLVRVAGAALAVLTGWLPASPLTDVAGVALATTAYLAVAGVGEVFWRAQRRSRGLPVFAALLLTDGLYLAAMAALTGGTASNVRFLLPLYVLAATLLASYRTGLKSALWFTLTLSAVYQAEAAGLLADAAPAPMGRVNLSLTLLMVWTVGFGAAAFSSVNERELRRRRYDLQALAQLGRELEGETEPGAIARATVEVLARACRVRRAVVVARTAAGYEVLARLPGDARARDVVGASPLIEGCFAGAGPVLVRRVTAGDDAAVAALLPAAENLVVLPLHDERRCTGAVLLECGPARHGRLERRSLSIMEQCATHAALALRRAWLLDELRRRAETDGLTGLANRRTFDETLTRELSRAGRGGGAVALLLFDIDHFKKLNDTHGHQTGDQVLRELGAILRQHARDFDTAARYGGEEFALILPGCTLAEARSAAERIRSSVASADTTVAITVSIGVASHPGDGADTGQLIREADLALYAAKHAGRNRVGSAPSPALETAGA